MLDPMPNRVYRLLVEGELGETATLVFRGMVCTKQGGNTLIVGPVRDQAELQGLLERVSDLGLTLLSAVAEDGPTER